ncbi:MAG: phytoene desaturase [Planctomycetes bacterium]|nr:phytoene desaturase [Planctomycetota bacterium]
MPTPNVVVIGGGLAGLAAAAELSTAGVKVTLVESNKHLGGKMNLLEEQGFKFDMGPTILTMPQVLKGIIRRSGRRVEDLIDFVDLDPQWRCHFEDGTVIDLRKDVNTFAQQLDQQFPNTKPGDGYKQFIEYSRKLYRLSEKVFFYKDLGAATDLMFSPPKAKGIGGDLMTMVATMHSTVAAQIEKHVPEPHLRQVMEHFLQYVGSSPFMAPSILSLIAAAQVDYGCWYSMAPKKDGVPLDGGTRCVARALAQIGKEQGVNYITGRRVSRIVERDGKVIGVELESANGQSNGQNGKPADFIPADAVVSNCDVQRTNRDLLAAPAARAEQRSIAKKYTPACSGVVLYLGLNKQYDHVSHHNFFFSKNSHEEFNDIYTRGIPARDPTLYIAAPSRSDPTQAPPGGEALYVLIHTPYIRDGQKWDGPGGLMDQYKPVVLDKMRRMGFADIDRHIVIERTLSPAGIEKMYNAEGGAIYGLASHGRMHGGFKPKNRSRVYKNLYLAGGSANPGPGTPMVMMSGVTAANCLLEDWKLPLPTESGRSVTSMVEAKAEPVAV